MIENNKRLEIKNKKKVSVFKEVNLGSDLITLYKVEKSTGKMSGKMDVFGGEENDT